MSRAAGAPLLGGNALELLIDAAAHFDSWLKEIRGARRRVLLENYIIRDDEVGRAFRDALVERAQAGVMVAVVVDWLGWPASIGWPFGALAGWTGLNLGIRSWRHRGRHRREGERDP